MRGEVRALLYLGRAYRATGQHTRGIAALNRSLTLSRSVAQRVMTLEALAELAELEQAGGSAGAALNHLRAYYALRDTIFDQGAAQRIAAMEARNEAELQQRENMRLVEAQRDQALVIARQRTVAIPGLALLVLAAALVAVLIHFNREGRERESLLTRANAELEASNGELRTALSEVRELKGLIPICARCKKVRDDRGFWEAVETYISSRSDALFSHGICATCGPELYGDDWNADTG